MTPSFSGDACTRSDSNSLTYDFICFRLRSDRSAVAIAAATGLITRVVSELIEAGKFSTGSDHLQSVQKLSA